MRTFPEVPASWLDEGLGEKWSKTREIRRVVTGALEIERAEKRIGSSLQASPKVFIEWPFEDVIGSVDMAEIAITSGIELVSGPVPPEAFVLEDVAGVGVVSRPAEGHKCQRCWRILPEVGSFPDAPETCGRCADAVIHLQTAAQ